jgi:hypothetical protein
LTSSEPQNLARPPPHNEKIPKSELTSVWVFTPTRLICQTKFTHKNASPAINNSTNIEILKVSSNFTTPTSPSPDYHQKVQNIIFSYSTSYLTQNEAPNHPHNPPGTPPPPGIRPVLRPPNPPQSTNHQRSSPFHSSSFSTH